ncbi:MAG TPA: tetratricopeptide repeat protein [Thermomicrobiales bacterium]|nr:tetratricopeptide repeat protein [Thermomicrobiales bacterium]
MSRLGRMQIAFLIVSSLVICGMIGAAVFTISAEELFGDMGETDEGDLANFQDPSQDLIAEQQTVVAENPDDLEETLLLANLLGNSGRLSEAIPLFERAISLAPGDAEARVSFARALADGGMAADAELQFIRALELDPRHQAAHYYLAELYRMSTTPRTDEAIVHYRQATEIDPSTLIGERAATQLASLGGSTPTGSPPATPS